MSEVYFDDIGVGDRIVTGRRTITEADIVAFAGVSGDFNPLHTDEVFVRENTPFDGRIAHGVLGIAVTTGLRSTYDDWQVIAFLECNRKFTGPIYPQDTVHAVYEVTEARASRSKPGTNVVVLSVQLVKEGGDVVQTGTDVVLVASRKEQG
ncbi:MAG: MaoC family dehydratase [Streptosporangiales bacterium]